ILDADVAIFAHECGEFILQDYYVQAWAENTMVQLVVPDLRAWWAHLDSLRVEAEFGCAPPKPPRRQSWGLVVGFVLDPAGVLWHVTQLRSPEQIAAGETGYPA